MYKNLKEKIFIIQGVLKRYVKNLRKYSSHLKDEKMLYGHRYGNAYFRSYVENTVSCITYTRKNLGLISKYSILM